MYGLCDKKYGDFQKETNKKESSGTSLWVKHYATEWYIKKRDSDLLPY